MSHVPGKCNKILGCTLHLPTRTAFRGFLRGVLNAFLNETHSTIKNWCSHTRNHCKIAIFQHFYCLFVSLFEVHVASLYFPCSCSAMVNLISLFAVLSYVFCRL